MRLNLKFYPDQPLKFPTSTLNTGRQLMQASDGLLGSALRRYRAVMATVDAVRINIQALRSTLSGVFATIQRQFSSFMTVYSDATALVHSLVNAPYTVSTMFSTFFASFQGDSRRSSRERGSSNVGAGGTGSGSGSAGGGSTGSGSGSSGSGNTGAVPAVVPVARVAAAPVVPAVPAVPMARAASATLRPAPRSPEMLRVSSRCRIARSSPTRLNRRRRSPASIRSIRAEVSIPV